MVMNSMENLSQQEEATLKNSPLQIIKPNIILVSEHDEDHNNVNNNSNNAVTLNDNLVPEQTEEEQNAENTVSAALNSHTNFSSAAVTLNDNLVPEQQGEDEQNAENAVSATQQSQNDSSSAAAGESIQPPHSALPPPAAPAGLTDSPPPSPPSPATPSSPIPAIGKFIRDKSNGLSAALTRRLSSLREQQHDSDSAVTEFNLIGLKVTKSLKLNEHDLLTSNLNLKGRVSFFSRSNCRDCTAVRSFLRYRNLNFVEINIDVFPAREQELIDRTGTNTVPQIFFNEKLIGGLVVLNSLRNSGTVLESKITEMLSGKCPDEAPAPPVYGFDDDEILKEDEAVQVVRVLRQKLPIKDRLMKMKIVKNCFSGRELVEVLIHHLDCGRTKAIDVGKRLAKKHFIHHVFGENEFEDGNHMYRFLEHEPFIPKCHNFRGFVNDNEPKAADVVGKRLAKIMQAILESYASDDRCHLDYVSIGNSEEFRRYMNLVEDLQRVNITKLSEDEKLAFFLNLHNAMAIHAVIRIGHPGGMLDRMSFFEDFMYIVGGLPFSLSTIRNGILRGNRRAPFSLTRPFSSGDKRLELAFSKANLLIHFGLCNATKGSPGVKFFTPQGVQSELRYAAREFFLRDEAANVDLAKRTVHLSRIIKWYSADFGQEKEILKWIMNYLDATKAGLLTHLLSDGGPVNVVYQNFDWSPNS